MITTFTRVPIDNLDEFLQDEEVVLALTEQFGFDPEEILNLASDAENVDPMSLFQTMEERWNGEGQTFSIEDQLPLLNHLLNTHYPDTPLQLLTRAGRPTPVRNDLAPIRILLPNEIKSISLAINEILLENLQAHANLDTLTLPNNTTLTKEQIVTAPLWQLYDGLTNFLKNAAQETHHILIATTQS